MRKKVSPGVFALIVLASCGIVAMLFRPPVLPADRDRAMPNSSSLKSKIIVQSIRGLVFVACLLFIPAGSLRYWEGWVYLAIMFFPSIPVFVYLYKHDPRLIERRMQTKEHLREQKLIMKLMRIGLFVGILIPGLDYRFGWSHAPYRLVVISQVVALGGYLLTLWVIMVNSYASTIIEVEAGQRVISSGPYRVVRHPMYLGAVLMMLFTPFALGSYWALPGFLLILPLLVFRILSEEKLLLKDLPGYSEYCVHTRFRLIPFVW